ncbi:MAG: XRE family transcriptional regulator [Clostridia bacterium]|nr:XRE family transcriptional regulator [Clostridia bacterium]
MEQGTGDLLNKLINVKGESQLDSYIDSIKETCPQDFKTYITAIMEREGIDKATLPKIASLERTYVYQLLNGKKTHPGKDKVVLMALALRMSVKETQRALDIAGAATLYPKNPRDSILIYALSKRLSIASTNALLVERGEKELE